MTLATQRQVYSSYRFWVEINGITEGHFSECSGLQAETEVFEWEEGGLNGYKHRLPGRTKFPNLVLKRGVATAELWNWYANLVGGTVQRQQLSVVLYGYAEVPEIRWNFDGVLPIKWTGPTFKTGASEVAIETLEIVHHGFKRV